MLRLRALVLKGPRAIRGKRFLNDLTSVLEASMVTLAVGKHLRQVTHSLHTVQLFHVLAHAILYGVFLCTRVHRCRMQSLMVDSVLTWSFSVTLSVPFMPLSALTAIRGQYIFQLWLSGFLTSLGKHEHPRLFLRHFLRRSSRCVRCVTLVLY